MTSLERVLLKEAPSFAFATNNESSNGMVYLFHSNNLLNVKEEGPSVREEEQLEV